MIDEHIDRSPFHEALVARLDPEEADQVLWVTPGRANDGRYYLSAAMDGGDAPYNVYAYGDDLNALPEMLVPRVKQVIRAFAAANEAFCKVMEEDAA